MCFLNDGQLRVRVRHREVGVGSVAGAVEHQGPLLQEAVVHALTVEAYLEDRKERIYPSSCASCKLRSLTSKVHLPLGYSAHGWDVMNGHFVKPS